MGIELVTDQETKNPAGGEAEKIFYRALQKGLSLKITGNILALSPPLIITKGEMERALSIVDSCLKEVEQGQPSMSKWGRVTSLTNVLSQRLAKKVRPLRPAPPPLMLKVMRVEP